MAAETPLLYGDPDLIRQVLLILTDNALKYTPSDGRVLLTARAAPPSEPFAVALAVSDTGVGMPAETLSHVFERFYRGDVARTRTPVAGNETGASAGAAGSAGHPGSGAGLGLSIADQLTQAQGGHITIESTVGVGTTVTVTLPAHDVSAATTYPPALPPAMTGSAEGR